MVLVLRAPLDFKPDDRLARKELFADYCKFLVNNNRHMILAICGKPGKGKTYSAMDLANTIRMRTLKRPFNPQTHLALDALRFLEIVNTAEPGEPVIFDEIGAMTGFNSRKSFSPENVALSSLFQTIRSRRLIIILTTPSFRFIDVSARSLVDFKAEAMGVDKSDNTSKLLLEQLQFNTTINKLYFHALRVYIPEVGECKMPHIYTAIPTPEQINMYEEMKFNYQQRLNKKVKEIITQALGPSDGGVTTSNGLAPGESCLPAEVSPFAYVKNAKRLAPLDSTEEKIWQLYCKGYGFTEIYKELGDTTLKRLKPIVKSALAKNNIFVMISPKRRWQNHMYGPGKNPTAPTVDRMGRPLSPSGSEKSGSEVGGPAPIRV